MARARKRKKEIWYSCDFETDTTSQESTFVWAWGCMQCGKSDRKEFKYGTSLSSFIDYVFTLDFTPVLWFHNLKFDGSFLIDWLLRNGWEYTYCRDEELNDNQFTALISDMGQWYMIAMCKNGKVVKCQNSLLKIPMSVSQIAKKLKLDVLKGEIDYAIYREEGAVDLNEADKEYLFRDVYIVARALDEMFLSQHLTSMTVGSDCLSFYKTQLGFKRFPKLFPELDEYTDMAIRKAYRGGWVYKKPERNYEVNGVTVDYNSMYPSQMHSKSGNLYPCGEPKYFDGKYEQNIRYPLYVQRIRTSFTLKDGFLPTIQLKNTRGFLATEYVKTTQGEIVELTLTNVDLELFFKHYEVETLQYIDGYMFHGRKKLFDEYINFWFDEKVKCDKLGDEVGRQRAKYFLNNLYGKFGTHPAANRKEPFLNDDSVKFTMVKETRNSVYIPVACYVTAYARREVITGAQNNYKNFCYADTDSLHLSCDESDITGVVLHPTNICAWKCEGKWSEAIFVRAKTYMEHINNEYWLVKCAGMPENVKKQVTPANFKSGSVFHGKLRQKRVKGGVVLIPTTFQIR